MANSDKDILITPNKGTTSLPEISFVGQNNVPIKLTVTDANALSFATSTSVTSVFLTVDSSNTSANLFAVADVTGTTHLNVKSDGTLCLGSHFGNIAIGQETASAKVDIYGPHGVTSFTGSSKLGLAIRGSTVSSDYSGIDFYGYYGSQKQALRLGYDRPFARIAARFNPSNGSYLSLGTSNTYATGITNTAITIDPSGYVGINSDPVSVMSIASSGATGITRQLTLHQVGQPAINFGSYPANWNPALMIQNINNTDFIWLSPIDDGYNARFRTGGCGLDFYIAGGNDTGNLMFSLNTDTLNASGGNGNAHIFGPLRQQATYTYGRHYSIYTYQSGAGGGYYIHMKTNIPWFNSFVMFNIQATGYAYGNSQYIDCRWTGYTYYTAGLINVSYNNVTSGMSANTMYQSSDGYLVLVGYSSGHYYIGFTLDAGFYCPTPGGYDFRIFGGTYSSSQTGVY